MPASPHFKCAQRPAQGGFALVIALSLMAFVLLLLLSITTLVQVETQGSQIQMQQMEAEQSALLGLQIALGELQKTAGPDHARHGDGGYLRRGRASSVDGCLAILGGTRP